MTWERVVFSRYPAGFFCNMGCRSARARQEPVPASPIGVETMPITVAVDAMGGDHAPAVVVEGAWRAVQQAEHLRLVLFGPEHLLRTELDRLGATEAAALTIVHAPDTIGMDEAPTVAVKQKPHSSIHLGLGAHKQGRADAFVSAGNTGAVMAASVLILGRVGSVSRPSVIGFFPTTRSYAIVMDVGANVDCKPEHLAQFAQMGAVYAGSVMKRERPIVALLNVGAERGKGTEAAKAAYDLLEAMPGITFKGNIEGRDIMEHAADVVICDGFVGNALLKFGESVPTAFMEMVEREMAEQQLDGGGKQVVRKVLRGVQKRFDYEEYGAAPLLGVNGNVLIGHGGSSARAIERMIFSAVELVEQNVTRALADVFAG